MIERRGVARVASAAALLAAACTSTTSGAPAPTSAAAGPSERATPQGASVAPIVSASRARDANGANGASAAKEGDELIGTTPPEWSFDRWIGSPPLTLASLRGRVVLVRWFMSPACPYCSATAPSLRAFDAEYRDRGLSVIGVYHHKDPQPLDPAKVEAQVRDWGFRFPVAIDPEWRTLHRWWLDGHDRGWTSVSFVLDRAGRIRFVHPGGRYAPGDADYVALQRTIEALLAER